MLLRKTNRQFYLDMLKGCSVFARKRKFIASYIMCVVLPVFLLGIVLKWGGTLVGRPVLSGLWRIEIKNGQLGDIPCRERLLQLQKALLGFSQSGKTFSLILNGAQLQSRGVLEGNSLKGSFTLSETDHSSVCNGLQQELDFEAAIDPKSDARLMNGVLMFTGCGTCRPIPFQAVWENIE